MSAFERPVIFYDIEVFKHDWFVCFIDTDGNRQHFHNGGVMKMHSIINNHTLVGYNNHHYDDVILSHILYKGYTPQQIKELNDDIIVRHQKRFADFKIVSIDIMPKGIGLKEIEAKNGADIEHTEVDFDIDRALTESEIESTLKYCYYDVEWTKNTYEYSPSLLQQMEFLAKEVPDVRADGKRMIHPTRLSNQRLSAEVIGYIPELDSRVLVSDELMQRLPEELQSFYESGNMTPALKDLKLNPYVGGLEEITLNLFNAGKDILTKIVVSGGGAHGTEYSQIVFYNVFMVDVGSQYPSIAHGYRLLGNATDKYKSLIDLRFKYVSEKGKYEYGTPEYAKYDALQTLYKLLINALYGLLRNKYFADTVFNPRGAESICAIGQIGIFELTIQLIEAGFVPMNINTDGIGYHNPNNIDQQVAKDIFTKWEEEYGLKLGTDHFDIFIQKDVNNYLAIVDGNIESVLNFVDPEYDRTPITGKIKSKGGTVSKYNLLGKKGIIKDSINQHVIDLMLVHILQVLTSSEKGLLNELEDMYKTSISETVKDTDIIRADLDKRFKTEIIDSMKKVYDNYGIMPFVGIVKLTQQFKDRETGELFKGYHRLIHKKGDEEITLPRVNRYYNALPSEHTGQFLKYAFKSCSCKDETDCDCYHTDEFSFLGKHSYTLQATSSENVRIANKLGDNDDVDYEYYYELIMNRLFLFFTYKNKKGSKNGATFNYDVAERRIV